MNSSAQTSDSIPVELENFLQSADTIPPASRVLAKLSIIISDDNASIYDIVSLIKYDASLTGILLRVSNSALFGGTAEITNLEDAVNRLGFREVYKITSAIAARQLLEKPLKAYNMSAVEVFSVSVAAAILCEEMSEWIDDRSGAAYTYGLMHLIGRWIINEHIENFRPNTAYEPGPDNLEVPDWERKHFGFDFARVGGSLLKKWGFPPEVHIPVTYQLNPTFAPFLGKLAAILAIAVELVPRIVYPNETPEDEDELRIDQALLDAAGLRLTQVEGCLESTMGEFTDAMRVLNVG